MASGGSGGASEVMRMFVVWSWLKKFSPLPGDHLLLFVFDSLFTEGSLSLNLFKISAY